MQDELLQVPSRLILEKPSRHSTTGTLSSRTSGSRRISLILLQERTRRRIRLCQFCTLVDIVKETAIVSFRTLPVGFPLPTIPKNCPSCFVPWILDRGVSFIISISAPKILISYVLLETSFHHSFQSVIIRSYFLTMNLQDIQFQYGLKFLRLLYSSFVFVIQRNSVPC